MIYTFITFLYIQPLMLIGRTAGGLGLADKTCNGFTVFTDVTSMELD